MSKSKDKGNTFERVVAKFLSVVFEESFVRTPTSGAFVGGQNKKRIDTLSVNQTKLAIGDIIPPDKFQVVLECKNYSKFSFPALFSENKQLDSWIAQLEGDIKSANIQYGLLFVKVSYNGTYVLFNRLWYHPFKIDNHLVYKGYCMTDMNSFISDNVCHLKNIWTGIEQKL